MGRIISEHKRKERIQIFCIAADAFVVLEGKMVAKDNLNVEVVGARERDLKEVLTKCHVESAISANQAYCRYCATAVVAPSSKK